MNNVETATQVSEAVANIIGRRTAGNRGFRANHGSIGAGILPALAR